MVIIPLPSASEPEPEPRRRPILLTLAHLPLAQEKLTLQEEASQPRGNGSISTTPTS